MRYFALKNTRGETYDISNPTTFFHNPKGLGFELDGEMKKLGNSYFRENRTIKQKEITGTMFFRNPHAYDEYENFVRYLNRDSLILVYSPKGRNSEPYEIEVECSSLEKGELGAQGLYCDIVFTTLSLPKKPFYVETNNAYTTGRKYDYKYNYRYSENVKNAVAIDVDGDFDTPVKMVIYGRAKNPKWRHYVDGEIDTTGEIFTEILPGNRMVIDSNVPYTIIKQDANGNLINNVYQLSNFETKRFIFLKRGRNVITVSEDLGRDVNFYIVGGINYASV